LSGSLRSLVARDSSLPMIVLLPTRAGAWTEGRISPSSPPLHLLPGVDLAACLSRRSVYRLPPLAPLRSLSDGQLAACWRRRSVERLFLFASLRPKSAVDFAACLCRRSAGGFPSPLLGPYRSPRSCCSSRPALDWRSCSHYPHLFRSRALAACSGRRSSRFPSTVAEGHAACLRRRMDGCMVSYCTFRPRSEALAACPGRRSG